MNARKLAARAALPVLAVAAVSAQAHAADFEWKKFQGKTVTFLANNNPLALALLSYKADFEKLTGMTLKFSYAPWARVLSRLLGGFEAAGFIHRVAAVLTFTYFGIHLVDLFRRKTASRLSWWRFIRSSRQPELPVVLLEDTGALCGLFFALAGVVLAHVTGEPRWDAVGSLAITEVDESSAVGKFTGAAPAKVGDAVASK